MSVSNKTVKPGDIAKSTRLEDIVGRWLNSPEERARLERESAETAKRRVVAARELESVTQRAIQAAAIHATALAAAKADVAKAAAGLKAAQMEMQKLVSARSYEAFDYCNKIEALEKELYTSSSNLIDNFVERMWFEWERSQKIPFPVSGTEVVHFSTGKKEFVAGPLLITPPMRVDAIRGAIASAQGLRLEPDQSVVAERLAALEAGLPIVGAPVPK